MSKAVINLVTHCFALHFTYCTIKDTLKICLMWFFLFQVSTVHRCWSVRNKPRSRKCFKLDFNDSIVRSHSCESFGSLALLKPLDEWVVQEVTKEILEVRTCAACRHCATYYPLLLHVQYVSLTVTSFNNGTPTNLSWIYNIGLLSWLSFEDKLCYSCVEVTKWQ